MSNDIRGMTTADQYRALAAQMRSHASHETNPILRAEWDNLARCYLRLAEQADRNSRTDIVYEAPMRPRGEPDGAPPADR
jgi:hypothetical protein